MNIREYINQLPERTPCEKDPKLPEQHARVGAVFREDRNRSYEEPGSIPPLLIDPLF